MLALFFGTYANKHIGRIKNSLITRLYSVLGYLLIFLKHLLPLPFFLILLQSFLCKDNTLNSFNEPIAIATKAECWSAEQIVFVVVGLLVAVIYALVLASTIMLYSSRCYISPLPWSDDEISMQLVVLLQKLLIALLLIFDPEVYFKLTSRTL